MFKPAKNLKSIEIMSKKKRESLRKIENGKTANLDFFKTVPDLKRALSPNQKSANSRDVSKSPNTKKLT